MNPPRIARKPPPIRKPLPIAKPNPHPNVAKPGIQPVARRENTK
jgi:hypothetical protein